MALGVSFIGHVVAWFHMQGQFKYEWAKSLWWVCLLYTSDAADDSLRVDLGGRRII